MISNQLLEEIERGERYNLKKLTTLIQPTRNDRPVTLSCVLRWVNPGVKMSDGTRIKLEAARLSNKWITTSSALRRFIIAQTTYNEKEMIDHDKNNAIQDR